MIYSRSPIFWGEDYNPLDPDKIKWKVMLPYPQVLRLFERKSTVAAVLCELVWLHFEQRRNPVRYSGSRLSRYVRRRGLQILKREKWIHVEQERGKAPVVTLLWLKPTRADPAQKPGRILHKTRANSAHPLHILSSLGFSLLTSSWLGRDFP
jgi:hypothetical protein